MLEEILYGNQSLNIQFFHLLNNIQDSAFVTLMQVFSTLGKYYLFLPYMVVFTVCAVYYGKTLKAKDEVIYQHYCKKLTETLFLSLIAYGIFLLWVSGLKNFFHFPRPYVRLPQGSVHILEKVKAQENPYVSFPSGHAAFSVMMLVVFWNLFNFSGKIIGILLVGWICVSRIALGVHFPSDVIASAVLSFYITYFSIALFRPLIRSIPFLKSRYAG